jgi:hypothetical protein
MFFIPGLSSFAKASGKALKKKAADNRMTKMESLVRVKFIVIVRRSAERVVCRSAEWFVRSSFKLKTEGDISRRVPVLVPHSLKKDVPVD